MPASLELIYESKSYNKEMAVSRKDQILFAKEILGIVENTSDIKVIEHALKISDMLVALASNSNGVACGLNEYIYELAQVLRGEPDTGWKDRFRADLYEELEVR
jgi:hypothetical protein